jgi:hypothetical protein
MTMFDCALQESLCIGKDIRLNLTGRVDGLLYVFIDAAARHAIEGVCGFNASAPSGIDRIAHVLALHDAETFCIGPARITVEAVHLRIAGANALRDVRLQINAPEPLRVVRKAPLRPARPQRLAG